MNKLIGISLALSMMAGAAMAAPATFGNSTIVSDGTESPWTKQATLSYVSSTFPSAAQSYTVVPRGAVKVYGVTTASGGLGFVVSEVDKNGVVLRSQTVTATVAGVLALDAADPVGFAKISVSPTAVPTGSDSVKITVISAVPGRR